MVKKVVLIGIALALSGCVATEPRPDPFQTYMAAPSMALVKCSVEFERLYQTLPNDAASISAAYDAYCSRQEGALRLSGYDVERQLGTYDPEKARYWGNSMVADLRNKTVGAVILKKSRV